MGVYISIFTNHAFTPVESIKQEKSHEIKIYVLRRIRNGVD